MIEIKTPMSLLIEIHKDLEQQAKDYLTDEQLKYYLEGINDMFEKLSEYF